MRNNQPV